MKWVCPLFSRRVWVGSCVLLIVLVCTSVVSGHEPPLPRHYDLEYFDVDSLLEAAESGSPFPLYFRGAEHWIQVEKSLMRSERFRACVIDSHGRRPIIPKLAKLFKGKVLGDPESFVRMSFTPRGTTAFIKTHEGITFVEPMVEPMIALEGNSRRYQKAQAEAVHRVFTERDLEGEFVGTCGCTETAPHGSHFDHVKGTIDSLNAVKALPAEDELLVMEIAVEVDYQYYEQYGEDTTATIEAIFNTIEGIYEADLGLTLELTTIDIYDEGEGPYESTDALDLLYEFRSRWNSEKAAVPRDVAHLFTGKDLDSTTVGIAFVSEVCHIPNAYSLSQDIRSPSLTPLLVAHEIGHNLGAYHDDPQSSPKYIMQPVLGHSTLSEFSDESQTDIQGYLSRSSVNCLHVHEPEPDDDSEPGAGGGGTSDPPPVGGGGGGGPVDPLLLILVLSGVALRGLRREKRCRQ